MASVASIPQGTATDTVVAMIANGASLSAAVTPGPGRYLFALLMPAAWTPAVITFQGSQDGSTFGDVYDGEGTEKSIAVGASRFVYLDPAHFAGITTLKLRSGTAAAPVNQGAERAITLIMRPV